MKSKRILTFLYSTAFIMGTFVGLNIYALLPLGKVAGIIIASSVFILNAILCFVFKKYYYAAAVLLNGAASGIAIDSVYIHLNTPVLPVPCLIICLAFVFAFGIYCLLTHFSLFKNHPAVCVAIYFILASAAVITFNIVAHERKYMLSYFLLLPLLAMQIVLISGVHNPSDLIKNAAIGSFSALIIIIIIAITILSDGEAIDCFDLPDGTASSKKANDPYVFN